MVKDEKNTTKTANHILLAAELEAQRSELNNIHGSLGFQLVKKYWQVREAVLPPGTMRGSVYESLKRAAQSTTQLRSIPGAVAAPKSKDSKLMPWHYPLTQISSGMTSNKILIVAELSIRACRTYRVDHKVQMYESLGYEVAVVSWTDFTAARHELQTSALVIFYRVPANEFVKHLVAEAERLSIPKFFDIDDLVFDVKPYAELLAGTNLSKATQLSLLEGAKLYCEALRLAGQGIASTPTIAKAMERVVSGKVHIVSNAIDPAVQQVADEVRRNPPFRADLNSVVIGYGSGTDTHDADLLLATPALLRILKKYPHVQFVMHGPLKPSAEFKKVAKQITQIPFLEPRDYYRAVSTWDISIAPLTKQIFNDAKSNIKFLEASAFAVPSVCSPAEPFQSVIESGKNGMLAVTEQEWFECLETLVLDAKLRKRMGENARKSTASKLSLAAVAKAQLTQVLPAKPPARTSRRPKIMSVNVLFSPMSFGGATVVAEQTASRLARLGCDVTIVTGLTGTGLPQLSLFRYEALGLPVFGIQLPSSEDAKLNYQNEGLAEVFRNILTATKPDVVHFHSIQQLSASIIEVCLEMNIPYAVTVHDAWWICQRQFMLNSEQKYCFQKAIDLRVCAKCVPDTRILFQRDRYLRDLLNQAALILAPSTFQAELYAANGFRADRIKVNKNGVEVPALQAARHQPKQIRFAYLGGKAHHKGYFWMQEIFSKVKADNYTLKIVDIHRKFGDSPIKANDFHLKGDVEIVPPFSSNTLEAFFNEVDVLLMPSIWKESFGLAVREALARNVWVVTTDGGALGEDIVEGVNGNVIPMGDTKAFSTAIERLLKNPKSAYENPFRNKVNDYDTQSEQLKQLLVSVIKK
jgi:O-antigen biosynthesis protein